MKTEFPNGFTSWHETHFEVVEHISACLRADKGNTIAEKTQAEGGHGALYELAEKLTNEFENKYKGTAWGQDIEFFDTIEAFLEESDLNINL